MDPHDIVLFHFKSVPVKSSFLSCRGKAFPDFFVESLKYGLVFRFDKKAEETEIHVRVKVFRHSK